MSEIINETINELNKPTQNNVFSIEDNPVTVLEKINQVERYLKQIDASVDTSINTANEALEKANNAFEANGTLVKINGENQLTWSADFAESERQKSETDGAIVHNNEIADVEHIELIYDMSSSDANINWGYTSGIIFKTQTLNKDFTKYKKLRFLCNWNHHGEGWFSKLVYFDVYLDKVTGDNVYHGYLSMIPCNASDNDDSLSLQLFGRIEVNNVKTALSIYGYKINVANSTRVALDDTTNFPYFRIERIIGVY